MLIERRAFLALLGAVGATASSRASAQRRAPVEPVIPDEAYYDGVSEDGGFQFRRTNMNKIAPRFRRQLVKYIHKEPPGSLVVDSRNHALYVTFENNTALRYGVGVGKEGFQWFGRAEVGRKAVWPDWTPPAEMLARRPDLPRHMKGGPDNPLGPRAHYLYRDGKDLIYRIHGTTEPWTIGTDVSSGCIRMLNEDVIGLPAHAGRHPRACAQAPLAGQARRRGLAGRSGARPCVTSRALPASSPQWRRSRR
jgi:lipoprotein-anchoring transpeptidase ErfK/SrfK